MMFRDRRFAVSAVVTAAALVSVEVVDGSTATRADDDVRDEGTIEVFGAAMAVAVDGSCASLIRHRPVPGRPSAWWAGLALIWGGLGLNRASKRRLGRHYRPKVTAVSEHQLVSDGAYRYVRHPMYSGAVLICAGNAVTTAAPASALWALPILALVRRIRVEEALLRDTLGSDYTMYAAGRARLVPGLW